MTYFKIVDKKTGDESFISSDTAQTLKQVNRVLGLNPDTFELVQITYSDFYSEIEKVFEDTVTE